ncbi:MAG: pilus assembly protein PilM [bacterium]|nr:pilus assembly protein PilM [bacterium]
MSWSDTLTKYFPLPQYLTRPVTGLDISDRSIKFLALKKQANGFKVINFGTRELPPGVVESGRVVDPHLLSKILSALRKTYHLTEVAVALPEEESYLIDFKLPAVPIAKVREGVELALVDYLNFPVEQAIFDYSLLSDSNPNDQWLGVNASVLPKTVVAGYLTAVVEAGLNPLFFELEPQSLVRSLLPLKNEVVMIIDIGKRRTSFYVVDNGVVRYSTTLDGFSGDVLTAAVGKKLGLGESAAAEIKIKEGLLASDHQEIIEALKPLVNNLSEETAQRLRSWESDDGEAAARRPVERVVLTGGQATLPGLISFLTKGLSLNITIGDPWLKLSHQAKSLPDLTFNQSVSYGTAVGLALKPFL